MTQLTAISAALIADRVDQAMRTYVSGKSRTVLLRSSVEVRPDCLLIGGSLRRGSARGAVYCLLPLSMLARVAGEGDLFTRLTVAALLQLLWQHASVEWEYPSTSVRPVLTKAVVPAAVGPPARTRGGLFSKIDGEIK